MNLSILHDLLSAQKAVDRVSEEGGGLTVYFADATSRRVTAEEIALVEAAEAQAAADRAAVLQERQAAKAAVADLQVIIDGIDAATLAQAKGAIKQLAQITKGLIKAVVD